MRYFVLALAGLGLLGCDDDAETKDKPSSTCVATTDVSIKDFEFDPSCIRIAAGDTVTFTNDGVEPHTVTEDTNGGFDSGNMDAAATFTQEFPDAGTVNAHCEYHPSMTLEIRVE